MRFIMTVVAGNKDVSPLTTISIFMKTMESPPETFPFPFQPYDIQKDFMKQLYIALERGAVGIFESPTGTVFEC